MRTLILTGAVLSVCSIAHADTFVIDYTGRAQLDPAATFEADCLGATEAPDCAMRASLLEAELVEGLAELEGLSDDATKALFTNAVGSDSASVKEVGLRYFSRRGNLPSTLWTSVKEFFLGPDPQIGQPSAELLGSSDDETDQKLGELYLELRPSNLYDQNKPSKTGEQDEWARACASDALLDAVPGFAESEQFAPASRLLMIDHYALEVQTAQKSIPSTGFVTDAPRADVLAYFTKLFGKPASLPIGETEAKQQALNMELVQLQTRAVSGDRDAIKRLMELGNELTALSETSTAIGLLDLDSEQCPDCVFWYAGSAQDLYSKPFTRAVVVGTQAQLARTTISYLGRGGSGVSVPSDGGTPTQNNDGGIPTQSGDAGAEQPIKKSDGGCSTQGGVAGGWWLLALGLVLARRRRYFAKLQHEPVMW